jgi:glycosyltransferase involved in cell wall biosynthesis
MPPRTKIMTLLDTIATYHSMGKTALASRVGYRFQQKSGNGRKPIKQRDLLLLAWLFPPIISGGVYRPLSLVRYGAELGWKLSVISGSGPDKPTSAGSYLLQFVPKEVSVWRLKDTIRIPSYNWSPRISGGFDNALRIFSVGKKVLHDNPPATILATGPPFHSFVAAYYLARYFRSKLVLEYRDEWTECPFDFVQLGNADRKWEMICLQHADLVFFTTDSQRSHQIASFPILDPKKCRVIPNGWEPDGFENGSIHQDEKEQDVQRDARKLSISYIGTLGKHSLPGKFLRAVETILRRREDLRNSLEFRFVGQADPVASKEVQEFPFKENIRLIHLVPKDIANRMMEDSNALLLFNNEQLSRYIPGKIYDYMASGTPILVFGNGGEIGSLVTELKRGFVVDDNDVDALENILDTINSYNKKMERDDKFNEWLSLHTRKKLTEKMLMDIETL